MKQLDASQQGPFSQACKSEEADDEAPDPQFEDLDIHVDEIFAKYGMVKDYGQIHPVYLDLTNPDQFLLLTSGNVIKWARKSANLQFLSRKKHNIGAPTTKSDSSRTIVEMLAKWFVNQNRGANKQSLPPSAVYGDAANNLNDYLIFISIAPHKCNNILKILIDNDINNSKCSRPL
ncbi:hypothetical protein PCANC_16395 [Puccinia coronata f. sp. avenae]|uniref:Uncharacterized protein n=1 Tax=Puccinia coronata f. sp. avenae TaxID=200324 RepID=A0A2N5SYH9_9BASI|nr:hypothetical protein PCANC_16395 [Puccinia coronata f. sp. avenae]